MSQAKTLVVKSYDSKCDMCKKITLLDFTFEDYSKIKLCDHCYGSIPNYIPLSQDSQYVLAFIKKENNDRKKACTQERNEIF